jgi:uncharacterized BrkB/YihY/UPF0761 family membrane protein
MDAISIITGREQKRRSPSYGSQLAFIVCLSVFGGMRLGFALSTYLHLRPTYDWTVDLILGLTYLLTSIALAIRLWRCVKTALSA